MKQITVTGSLVFQVDQLHPEIDPQHEALQAINAVNEALDSLGLTGSPSLGYDSLPGLTVEVGDSNPDELIDLDECIENGTHLTDCDDDGYCNYCGEQTSAEEREEELSEERRRDEKNGVYPDKWDDAN